jgi:periplasmic copper chaperone A
MPRLIAGVLLLAAAAAADAPPAGPIAIRDAWARATPSGAKTGATYGRLVNTGASDDRLVGVSTPVAERAQLHAHVDAAGVMRMEPVSSIELTAGTSTVLAPGGRHIMLFGLKRPLKPGESFPLAPPSRRPAPSRSRSQCKRPARWDRAVPPLTVAP